ncbi:DEAD/DEAH box helicase [bacterium]|nr:DEAD/DEAH box helicase [bacterium]
MNFNEIIKETIKDARPVIRRRGLELIHKVYRFSLSENPNMIEGMVKGNLDSYYRVVLGQDSMQTDCSCAYHQEHYLTCKHQVALAEYAKRQDLNAFLEDSDDIFSNNHPRAGSEKMKEVSPVSKGLKHLQKLSGFTASQPQTENTPKATERSVIYVLNTNEKTADWNIQVMRHKVQGNEAAPINPSHYRKASQLVSSQPQYLSHEDFPILEWVKDCFETSIWATNSQNANPFNLKQHFSAGFLYNLEGQKVLLQQGYWTPKVEAASNSKGGLDLRPILKGSSDQTQELSDLKYHLFGSDTLAILIENQLYFLEAHLNNPSEIRTLLQTQSIPPEDVAQAMPLLLQMEGPSLELSEELKPQKEIGTPNPVLIISVPINGKGTKLDIQLGMNYQNGAFRIPFDSPTQSTYLENDQGQMIELCRNTQVEQDYKKQLEDLFEDKLNKAEKISFQFSSSPQKGLYQTSHTGNLTFASQVLPALGQDWNFEGLDLIQKFMSKHPKVSLGMSTGEDWFDLKGQVSYEGETFSLLEALKKSQEDSQGKFIRLQDGTRGILPQQLTRILNSAQGLSINSTDPESIRLSKLHAPIFGFLDELPEVEIPHRLELQKQLKKATLSAPKPVKTSAKIKATLRPYQEEGFHWLRTMEKWKTGGILADDMGLGKTLQVITLFCKILSPSKPQNASVIVMPTSLIFNWQREIEKFAPHLKIHTHHGAQRDKSYFDTEVPKNTIVLTSYPILQRDFELFEAQNWYYAILDEAQAIKNPLSKTHKAVCHLKAEHKLAMTGTPIENGLMDLWAQFNFVNPGLLGDIKYFKDTFAIPIQVADENEKFKDEAVYKSQLLRKITQPFYLRRTKEAVLKDLPPKEEVISYLEMSTGQAKLYKKTKDVYRQKIAKQIADKGIQKSHFAVLEGLLRLRQIACAPQLVEPNSTASSSKLEYLIEKLIEDIAEGHKALVFSQFTTLLGLVRKLLDQKGIPYCYLDGSTRKRQEVIDEFTHNHENKIFLISLKAGGTGLNLTGADYVFHLDPWWNPAAEAQATDRAHRIGQKNKVLSYKLISKDTVEEKILKLQEKKKSLSDKVLSSDSGFVKSLSSSMVDDLFS